MASTETTTTKSVIDPQIMRHVAPVLADVRALYESGKLGQVADQQAVLDALAKQQQFYQGVADQGLGTGAMLRDLRNTQGSLLGQRAGALGSARAGRSMDAAMLDRELQLNQADQAARAGAYGQMTQGAETARQLNQEQLDSEAKAAERFFGYLGAAPRQDTTVTTAPKQKSGGK